jgi:hypothetical protein
MVSTARVAFLPPFALLALMGMLDLVFLKISAIRLTMLAILAWMALTRTFKVLRLANYAPLDTRELTLLLLVP